MHILLKMFLLLLLLHTAAVSAVTPVPSLSTTGESPPTEPLPVIAIAVGASVGGVVLAAAVTVLIIVAAVACARNLKKSQEPKQKSVCAINMTATVEEEPYYDYPFQNETTNDSTEHSNTHASITIITTEQNEAYTTSVDVIPPELNEGTAVTGITTEQNEGSAITAITTEQNEGSAITGITTEQNEAYDATYATISTEQNEAYVPTYDSISTEQNEDETYVPTYVPTYATITTEQNAAYATTLATRTEQNEVYALPTAPNAVCSSTAVALQSNRAYNIIGTTPTEYDYISKL